MKVLLRKRFYTLVVVFSITTLFIFKWKLHPDRFERHISPHGDAATLSTLKWLEERKKNIHDRCAELNTTIVGQHEGANEDIRVFHKDFIMGMTDRDNSFVYCRVSKAASWYTISTLTDMLGYSPAQFRRYSAIFRNLPYGEMKQIFNSAFTFMFVREPYGRIFSTYTNKFYFPKGNWAPIGTEVVERYRGNNSSADSRTYGHDITFAELVRYIVDEYKAGHKMDVHIRPMHLNCKPCEYNYDFIGKIETMVPDWKYITEQLKSRNIIQSPPQDVGEKPTKASFSELQHFQQALEKIKNSNINVKTRYKRTWGYYQIIGVISKQIPMPFYNTEEYKIKFTPFLKELEKAAELSDEMKDKVVLQRHEAMVQAYSTVPMELLEELRKVLLEDCLIYGYDDRPDWIFQRENLSASTFNYFKDL